MSWISAIGKIASRIKQMAKQAKAQKNTKPQAVKKEQVKASKAKASHEKTSHTARNAKAKSQANQVKKDWGKDVKLKDASEIDSSKTAIGNSNNSSSGGGYRPSQNPYTPPRGKGRSR